MRSSRSGFRPGCWLLAAVALVGASANSPAATIATSNEAPAAKALGTPQYSPGLADVLKLVDAKVDPEVIKAYVRNSRIVYNPTASELILLKERGVPPDVVAGMIERGAQVRATLTAPKTTFAPAQGRNGQAQVAPAPAPVPQGQAPVYTTPPTVIYQDYSYSYPYYPYTYSYYWYNPWPYYIWPTYSYCWPYYGHYRNYCGYPYYSGFHGYKGGYRGGYYGGNYPAPHGGYGGSRPAPYAPVNPGGGYRGGGGFPRGGSAPVTVSRVSGARPAPAMSGGTFRPGPISGGFNHARAHR